MIYYNDNNPESCAWLKELITDQLISEGHIDLRSILDVQPEDVAGYRQAHFFAGIGGWIEALRLADWPPYIPVWTGSCPCQPFSCAGKGRGEADERHLWPEFRRLIDECRPPIVFGEQVASKAGRLWLSGVRADLEAMGYAVGAADLCAAGVSAPHIRQRLYWGAVGMEYPDCERCGEKGKTCSRSGACGSRELDRLAEPKHSVRRQVGIDRKNGRYGADAGRQEAHGKLGTRGQVCRLELFPRNGREQRRAESGRRVTECGCKSGGLDYPASDGARNRFLQAEQDGDGENYRLPRPSSTGSGGVGDMRQPGLEIRPGAENGFGAIRYQGQTIIPANPWSDSRPILCRDGKTRRIPVESLLFPVAHGVPGRVGLLRGAGNAIVPELAAEFIKAFLEAIKGAV